MKNARECMMTATDTKVPAAETHASLRERKKLATRRSLRRAALDLIAERGFSQVTVEDIAAAADVSPRTFFNYFPSKEAALFGTDPDRVAAPDEGGARRPAAARGPGRAHGAAGMRADRGAGRAARHRPGARRLPGP